MSLTVPEPCLRKSLLHAFLFSVLTLLAAAPVCAQAVKEIGIDRSGLSQQSAAVQQKTLEDIRNLGATWFRDGPTSGSPQGVANFVNEVRLADQQRLKMLVSIVQMDEDYDGPLTTHDHGWKAKKLSEINLDKFTRRFRNLLDALKAASLTIDAVEFGNEDDSYYYDADVPYDHYATPGELQTWLRGYGAFLKAGAEVLRDPRYYPHAKIITFGIAHGCDACGGPPRHLSNPARVVAMLKDVNGFNYLDNARYHVDGYGTHVYASPNDVGGSVAHTLREDAAALGPGRPLWVTEWGFQDLKSFPNRKGETLSQGLRSFLDAFDGLRGQMPIGPIMFYRYDVWLSDASGKLLPQAGVFSAYAAKR
jgi:hypothetical protein